jgi:hypothetical protein
MHRHEMQQSIIYLGIL